MELWNSEKSARILRSSGIWNFFRIYEILIPSDPNWHAKWIDLFRPGAVRICGQVPGRKRSIHFACRFGALISRISKIWKKCHNPEILRNLAHFSDLPYSTFRCSQLACKVNQLLPAGWVRICVMPRRKCWFTLHASSEHLRSGISRI